MLERINDFRKKHPLISGLVVMAIVFFIIIWAILIFLDVWTHHGDDTIVPDVKQLSFAEARVKLMQSDLDIAISDSVYDTSVPPGTVLEVVPKSGSIVKRGREVYVTVTAFSPKNVTITMPVTGVSSRQASSYLNALGIHAIRYVQVPSDYPDLVENAHADGNPIGVGSVIPVNASIVLAVGVARAPVEEPADSLSLGDYPSEPDYETADFSTYEDEE